MSSILTPDIIFVLGAQYLFCCAEIKQNMTDYVEFDSLRSKTNRRMFGQVRNDYFFCSLKFPFTTRFCFCRIESCMSNNSLPWPEILFICCKAISRKSFLWQLLNLVSNADWRVTYLMRYYIEMQKSRETSIDWVRYSLRCEWYERWDTMGWLNGSLKRSKVPMISSCARCITIHKREYLPSQQLMRMHFPLDIAFNVRESGDW